MFYQESLTIVNSSVDKTFYFWYSYLVFLLRTLTAVLHQLESNQVLARRCIFFKNNAVSVFNNPCESLSKSPASVVEQLFYVYFAGR